MRRAVVVSSLSVLSSQAALGCQVLGGFEDFAGTDARNASEDADEDGDSANAEPSLPCDATNTAKAALVARDDGTCWRVDLLEVSRARYREFMDEGLAPDDPSVAPPECSWNASFAPTPECEARTSITDEPDHPQVCIDFCDAQAFCRWHGNALCDGAFAQPSSSARSTWYAACADGQELIYPYGSEYSPQLCNGVDGEGGTTSPVDGHTGCSTSLEILNLSGNVAEWTDECTDRTGENDDCRIRGGSYFGDEAELRCATSRAVPRAMVREDIGFRCCEAAE